MKKGGVFGYIVSHGWLRLDSFESLRKHILSNASLTTIIDFAGNVFDKAKVRTSIVLFSKSDCHDCVASVATIKPTGTLEDVEFTHIPQSLFHSTYKSIIDLSIEAGTERVKDRMRSGAKTIGQEFSLAFGIKTGDDSKFLSYKKIDRHSRRLLRGEDIHRYSLSHKGEFVWYVPSEMTHHRRTARPGTAERYEQPKV
jgi:hypothetical protein